MCLKYVDFGIFYQRHGKEVCRYSCSGIANYSVTVVYYRDWWHVLLHLCVGLRSSYISGKNLVLYLVM